LAFILAPEPKTNFDVLPIVVQLPGRSPKMFTIPKEYIIMVKMEHPEYKWWADMNLQWCAVPAIAGFAFEIGGVIYPCAPFNGWFMDTEIVRDYLEPGTILDSCHVISLLRSIQSHETHRHKDGIGYKFNHKLLDRSRCHGNHAKRSILLH
jgi:nitric oxide synthase oxygenase domain/subunit